MSNKIKLLCEKLLLEIEFKKLDLKIVSEEFDEAKRAFNFEMQRYINALNPQDRTLVEKRLSQRMQAVNHKSWSNETTKKTSPETRKIFKKIANKTHPDKLLNKDEDSKEKLTCLYKKAQSAMSEDSLFDTMKLAQELDIEYDMTEDKKLLLQRELDKINREIVFIKKTLPWQWKQKGSQRKVVKDFVYGFLIEK